MQSKTCFVSGALHRWRIAALGAALVFGLTACGGTDTDSPFTGSNSPAASQSNTASQTSPTSDSPSTDTPSADSTRISGTPAAGVVAGETYSFTPHVSNPSGTGLSFLVTNSPSWATFNSSTGELTGVPTAQNLGIFANIRISVNDGQSTVALPAFSIVVAPPLTVSGVPAAAAVIGFRYTFQPTTDSLSGLPVVFTVHNAPAWATFSTESGELSGTPDVAGSFANIVISASDGIQTRSLPAFSVTVLSPNSENAPPTLSGHPPTGVAAGSDYKFTPTASDPDGRSLKFSIQNRPAWASFDTSNGQLTGTPSESELGTYADIVISASNGTLSASLPAFSIKVASGLAISGTPAKQATVGDTYSFQPNSEAPSGTQLAYSISNRPSWASFSSVTGKLSGTPTAGDSGTYANIVISVSDGTVTSSLPAFEITVGQPGTGNAMLDWTAVTRATNGTALNDLAGYKIYYGKSANAMTTAVTITNPSVTSYQVTNLAPGTWYFGVVAYTSGGVQGPMSNVGSTVVQ